MHKYHYFVILSAAVPFSCLAGCEAPVADSNGPVAQAPQPAQASQSRIGTINLARIYGLTGLQKQIDAKEREFKKKRDDLDRERNEAMQKKLKEFGDDLEKLTDEQKQELQQMQTAWVAARRETTAEAQQVMRETDQLLRNIFHQQTSEPIRKIAEARDLDVVLVMQSYRFAYVNPRIDITSEVIEQLDIRAAPPETTSPLTDLLKGDDEKPTVEPSPQEPAKDETPKDELPKEEPAADEDTTVPVQKDEAASGDDASAPSASQTEPPVVDGQP